MRPDMGREIALARAADLLEEAIRERATDAKTLGHGSGRARRSARLPRAPRRSPPSRGLP